MENKKFTLTNITKKYNGITLYQIRALRNIINPWNEFELIARKGELGGWVERENNLSQYGECWVGEDAIVMRGAKIQDMAQVSGSSIITEEAIIRGCAQVWGHTTVRGEAIVQDRAGVGSIFPIIIRDSAVISGNARINDPIKITGGEFFCTIPFPPKEERGKRKKERKRIICKIRDEKYLPSECTISYCPIYTHKVEKLTN